MLDRMLIFPFSSLSTCTVVRRLVDDIEHEQLTTHLDEKREGEGYALIVSWDKLDGFVLCVSKEDWKRWDDPMERIWAGHAEKSSREENRRSFTEMLFQPME